MAAFSAGQGRALNTLLTRVEQLELRDHNTQQHVRSLRASLAHLETKNQRLEQALVAQGGMVIALQAWQASLASQAPKPRAARASSQPTPIPEPAAAAAAAEATASDKAHETTPTNDDAPSLAGASAGHERKERAEGAPAIVGQKRRQTPRDAGADGESEGADSCLPKRSRSHSNRNRGAGRWPDGSINTSTAVASTMVDNAMEVAELLQGRGVMLPRVVGHRPQHVVSGFGKTHDLLKSLTHLKRFLSRT